jgi:hypothetical protein
VSLNFAVFRSAAGPGRTDRRRAGAARLAQHPAVRLPLGSRSSRLYKFNAKFCPLWVAAFFVFAGTRDAPRSRSAALEAEAFLVWAHGGGAPGFTSSGWGSPASRGRSAGHAGLVPAAC